MCIVNQPVKDGISERRVPDGGMPAVDRTLAGDDRRASAMPVVEHLEKARPRMAAGCL